MSKEFKTFNELEKHYKEKELNYHNIITQSNELLTELHTDKLKYKEKLDREFEKQIKKLFKGIKIEIEHNEYGLDIRYKNTIKYTTLFNYNHNHCNGYNIDCYDELIDIYNKYYGKPKEKVYPNFYAQDSKGNVGCISGKELYDCCSSFRRKRA